MRRLPLFALLSVTFVSLRCGTDAQPGADASGQDQSQSDSRSDTTSDGTTDLLLADSLVPDQSIWDSQLDQTPDGASDLTPDQDGRVLADTSADSSGEVQDQTEAFDQGQPSEVAAVSGERCTQGNRVGTVQVKQSAWGPSIDVSAMIYDRPEVLGNEAVFGNQTCTHYQQLAPGFCQPMCMNNTVCDASSTCVPYPQPIPDVVLTLAAADKSQTFEPQAGGTWGTLTLEGDAFSATVKWGPYTVTLEETPVAGPLENLAGTLQGGYDNPTGLIFTWTPAPSGSLLFTHIPINHHAGGPTYTECAVDASAGSMSISGDMLQPLAVSTGLEFQGLDHVRFAAALTPDGCIEFQFGTSIYVNLF